MHPSRFFAATFTAVFALPALADSLTAEQKAQALGLFQSASLATAAANSQNSELVGAAPGSDALSQRFFQMSSLLKSAIQSGVCVPINQDNVDGNTGATIYQAFSLSGSGCAVSWDTEDSSPINADGSQTKRYSVSDPSYAAMNDVDAVTMSLKDHLSPATNDSFGLSVEGDGSIHSQQFGSLAVTVSGSETVDKDNASADLTMSVQFPDFVAELHSTAQEKSGVITRIYSLNDEQLTADEVSSSIELPFAPKPKGAPAIGSFLSW